MLSLKRPTNVRKRQSTSCLLVDLLFLDLISAMHSFWCLQARDSERPLLPPKKWERDLLENCNRNSYERAIVLIEMARLPRLSAERHRLLTDAMGALMEAESAEQRIEGQVGFCLFL
jgi:hypothetical protein